MLIQATCEHLPLPAESVDLIFTDPPYLREYLPCYGWLAREAMRVLKPGGFVLAMCGGVWLNKIYQLFDAAGLEYFWEFHYLIEKGSASYVWNRQVLSRSKSILAYSKGPSLPRVGGCMSYFTGTKDKAWHHWGQDVDSARYYVDYFSGPDDLVLDPFIGGGTTAVACELIGRRWLGCDIDPAALATTQARMAETDIFAALPLFQQVDP